MRLLPQAGTGLILCVLLMLVLALPARAVTLIRDADIEYSLQRIANPVLQAAGLSGVKVLVVLDPSLNAFVADARHIFLHSGLIQKLTTREQLQFVIAHEAAHIANGHLARRATNLRSARTAAGLGLILAAATAAAGAPPDAVGGLAIGTQSSALRVFLGHTRAEEASADQSGVRYMARAGIDPWGAVEVHEIFRGQEALSESRQDPYVRSHPLTRDRMRAMKGYVAAYGGKARDDPAMDYWYARVRGKLSAFTRAPKWTLRRAGNGPTRDIALMREAIAYHRQANAPRALAAIDAAVKLRPEDAYLVELKGQIQLESRQAAAAVQTYRRAQALLPNNALILGGLGQALLAAGRPAEALPVLEKSRARDFRNGRVLRDLAVAYARSGQNGMASAVTAERYALQGRLEDAEIHAKRALGLLPRGSSGWQRAQDVLNTSQRERKRRNRG